MFIIVLVDVGNIMLNSNGVSCVCYVVFQIAFIHEDVA